MVTVLSDYNICYHGKDCTANSKRVYSYKKCYITSEFNNEGDDIDVLRFTDGRGNLGHEIRDWYEKCVKVHPKEDFDVHKFIGDTNKVDVLVDIYHNFYSKEEGLKKLAAFIANKYHNFNPKGE